MSKIKFSALVLLSLILYNVKAQTLNYGDVIHLQNGWNKYSGGFLDTRGYQKDFEKTGNHLCVSTAISEDRDNGSGTWKVISASGKAIGSPVLTGDNIHLLNQWNNENGGYLDTRGYQKDFARTGNHLCVSTAISENRDNGSGTWKISSIGKANGTPVSDNLEIQLKNGWNKFSGGFLDTRGYQKDYAQTGNHLCVSTAISENRDNGSGTWKVKIIKTTSNAFVKCGNKNFNEAQTPTIKAFGQSFKTCNSVKSQLEAVEFQVKTAVKDVTGILKIYKGEDRNEASLLHTQNITFSTNELKEKVSVPISGFSVQLQPNETYTFFIEVSKLITPMANYSNPYSEGRGFLSTATNPSWDFYFNVSLK